MTKENELIVVEVDGRIYGRSTDPFGVNMKQVININPNQPSILNWAKAEWNRKLEVLKGNLNECRGGIDPTIEWEYIIEEINNLKETK